ncbi:glutamate--cysteine ligase [Prochlorococcus marinus]|uniref:glutamate--cysteine ligase n=1 Tax=Prochlorococcus marinus TaxID=1219 RepID=UPI0022B4F87C|nr:glutamate--cysteine ligase [Prochlorococcus marinus]
MNLFLLKGFEVELFTGLYTGKHIGVSEQVANNFSDFVKEPDQRNLEYITKPERNYQSIKELLLEPRRRLRKWLAQKDLTILPGSTLSLGDSSNFERSDLTNSYHEFIELNYGTKVVTASIHINLGIEDLDLIFSALRLVRCEAALFLALSASSPFLDGSATGFHSQRWNQFPKTPAKVPLFLNHLHYVDWIEDQLGKGVMCNERHLWTAVRPNGVRRPYELNRLELRICDLITNCDLLLAITALLELRVISLINNPEKLDPLKGSTLTPDELSDLSDINEQEVAKNSLNATLHDWQTGKTVFCRDWIEELILEVTPLAIELNVLYLLEPIKEVLNKGNQSMRWLNGYTNGISLSDLLQQTIQEMEAEEKENFVNSISVNYP